MPLNKKAIPAISSILILFFLIFSGCAQQAAPSGEKPIKIGVLADLSGDYVHILRGTPRGIALAVEDLQKETGRSIQIIMEDQKSCDLKETVTIMNKFANIDNVDFVIGGSCNSTTLAAAPIANSSKTVLISPMSSAPSISDAGEYVFRTYISDALRGEATAKLAYEIGKRKMAFISEISNDSAVEVTRRSKEKFLSLGGEIVAEEQLMGKGETDFRTQLAKIKNSNPDVLFMGITSPKQTGLIAKQAVKIAHSTFVLEDGKIALKGGKEILKQEKIKNIYFGGR